MAGTRSSVAQRMKEICPNAYFIKCLAYCLNLAVSDVTETVHYLVTFVRNSCKRTDIFHCTQQFESTMAEDLGLEYGNNARISPCISLHPLCPTIWTVRGSAINRVGL